MSTGEPAARLAALAAGLCQDAGIGVEVHNGPWSWDPLRRVIRVSAATLQKHGPDYCASILTTEVGRSFLSRHRQFPIYFRSLVAGRALMDALDTTRVNRWMGRRYPGTRAWQDALGDLTGPPPTNLPFFLIFLREIVAEPLRGWETAPWLTHPDMRGVMEGTRAARRFYSEMVPPPDLDDYPDPEVATRFRDVVRPAMTRPGWPPMPREQLVLVQAYEALDLAQDYLFDVADMLLGVDLDQIESYLSANPARLAHAKRCMEHGDIDDLMRRIFAHGGAGRASAEWVSELARRLFEQHLLGEQPRPLVDSGPRTPGMPGDRHDLPERPPLPPLSQRSTDYDLLYRRVEDQVARLTTHLGEILRPRRRSRLKGGYPSGRRVDLRRLMVYEADPRRYGEIWGRTTIPDRRHAAISLLVDLSGSMDGEKVVAAQLGTILLAETLDRLEVPFAINGFQDVLVPVSAFGEPLGPDLRRTVASLNLEVNGSRPDGNNRPSYNDDGPCVLEAATELEAHPATDRILIVVSDGMPEGCRSDANDLRRVVQQLTDEGSPIELVALGLGPGTDHVGRFYPNSVANVPIDLLSHEIGLLIERILLH